MSKKHKKDKKEYYIPCPRCKDGVMTIITTTYKSNEATVLWDGNDSAYLEKSDPTVETQYTIGCNECPYSRELNNVKIDRLLNSIAKWAKDKDKASLPSTGSLTLLERPRDVGAETKAM